MLEFLSSCKGLTVNTGNINSWSDLKQKGISNPSSELQECLRVMFSSAEFQTAEESQHKSERVLVTSSNSTLYLQTEQKDATVNNIGLSTNESSERRGLKVTVKIFLGLTAAGETDVEKIVDQILKELGTDYIDSLIVAFSSGAAASADGADRFYEEYAKPVWLKMEQLVDSKKTESIGVADLDVSELRVLYEAARVKPSVNHYNISSCCSVPPELNQYAKDHGVQLLTHNDPSDFLPKEALNSVLKESVAGISAEEVGKWHVKCVARYTLMIKSRSVISAKGFLVDLSKL